jgi:hypothetical protein
MVNLFEGSAKRRMMCSGLLCQIEMFPLSGRDGERLPGARELGFKLRERQLEGGISRLGSADFHLQCFISRREESAGDYIRGCFVAPFDKRMKATKQ